MPMVLGSVPRIAKLMVMSSPSRIVILFSSESGLGDFSLHLSGLIQQCYILLKGFKGREGFL